VSLRRPYDRRGAVTDRAISDSLAVRAMIAASNVEAKGEAMAQPFIFIGTYTIKEGKLEDFKRYWPQFVEFIEESEPQVARSGSSKSTPTWTRWSSI
jgi:hypothetical protein